MNYKDYVIEHNGKQVLISTTSGRVNGILFGAKEDNEGNITALIVKQYLHKTTVPTEEILNVRLV